jgi:hypothetical protein
MHPTFWAVLEGRRSSTVAAVVYLSNAAYSTTVTDPTDATTTISFTNTRDLSLGADEAPIDPFWLSAGSASDYDIRVTPLTGTFSSGSASTGTWLNLGTTRSWNVAKLVVGSKTCTATYEIRMAASPFTVLGTATISITATVEDSGGGGGGITP